MARSFPIKVILDGVDNISDVAGSAFGKVEKRGRDAADRVRKGFRRAVSAIGAGAMGAAGITAAFVDKAMDYEARISAIQIQANLTEKETESLRESTKNLSARWGESRKDIIDGVSALVDLQGAEAATVENLELMTEAFIASKDPTRETSEQMQDLAGVLFALDNAFKFKNVEDRKAGLSAVIQAGKDGAIPMSKMAKVLQQVSAQFSKFGDEGKEGAAKLSAVLQVGRKSFGSAEETGTGLRNMITALSRHSDELRKKSGGVVNVFKKLPDGTKTLKPIGEIMDEIAKSKLIKDPSLLIKAFGSSEALDFFNAIHTNRMEFEKLTDSALQSNAVQEDALKRLQSPAQQYQKALNDIKNATMDAFDPETIKFVVEAYKGFAVVLAGIIGELRKVQKALTDFADDQAEQKIQRLIQSEQGFVDAVEDSERTIKNRAATELRAMMAHEGLLNKQFRSQEEFLAASARVAELSSVAQARARESHNRRILLDAERSGALNERGKIDNDRLDQIVYDATIDRGMRTDDRLRLREQIAEEIRSAISQTRISVGSGGQVTTVRQVTPIPAAAPPSPVEGGKMDRSAQDIQRAAESMSKAARAVESMFARMATASEKGAR